MKPPFDDLESELRALKPATPPARLRAEVLTALPAAAPPAAVQQGSALIFARLGPWFALAAVVTIVVGYFAFMPKLTSKKDKADMAAFPAVEAPANDAATAVTEAAMDPTPLSVPPDPEPEFADAVPLPEGLEDTRMAAAGFRPVRAQNALLSRVDDGLVTLEDGIPARRFRYQFLDTVVWEDPVDGALVEMTVPREELVVVPVRTF